MKIEKTEFGRLGYEYIELLEHIAYICQHVQFIKDNITEEATGDCEII